MTMWYQCDCVLSKSKARVARLTVLSLSLSFCPTPPLFSFIPLSVKQFHRPANDEETANAVYETRTGLSEQACILTEGGD